MIDAEKQIATHDQFLRDAVEFNNLLTNLSNFVNAKQFNYRFSFQTIFNELSGCMIVDTDSKIQYAVRVGYDVKITREKEEINE